MGQNEVKPLNQRSIYLGQIDCPNKNKVITGIMAKAQRQFENSQPKIGKENIFQNQRFPKDGKLTRIKSIYNPNQSTDLRGALSDRSSLLNRNIATTNPHNNSIQILKDRSTFQNTNGDFNGKLQGNTSKNAYFSVQNDMQNKNQINTVNAQQKQQQPEMMSKRTVDSRLHLNTQGSVKKIFAEDDDQSLGQQISNFHRQITDTIQKDQMNSSFQTMCRESVRNQTRPDITASILERYSVRNTHRNNQNAIITERFSVQPSLKNITMCPINSNEEETALEEGLLRRQTFKSQAIIANSSNKMKVDCSFVHRLFGLPENCLRTIFYFLFDEQHNLRRINSLFYFKLSEILEAEMVILDNSFIKNTMSFLSFKDSYLSQQPMKFRDLKGFRMDRHIIAEILPNLKGYNTQLSFSFKYASSVSKKKNHRYFVEYCFDAVDDKKIVWAFKEDSKHNYDAESPTFLQPITPVRIGDNIKISINFYGLGGMIDMNSIIWNKSVFSPIPKIPIMLNPNEIQGYDANRICEIEYLYTSWFQFNYFQSDQKCKLDFFEPYLHLKETRCAGVDLITSKLIFVAKYPGYFFLCCNKYINQRLVPKSVENFGVKIKVVPRGDEAICSVKKLGIFSDSENSIELRVGDIFIFYISKGD